MPPRLLALLCALLLPTTAAGAGVRVMCYGDSITAGESQHPEESYPGQLQQLRPDLEVVNEGQPGDVTDNLDRFHEALARSKPQVVVLMLGTNDAVCGPATPSCRSANTTPERAVANLMQMADDARRAGAIVVVLTPPPAVCTAACSGNAAAEFTMAVRHAFTARVAEDLLRARRPSGVTVADLRGRFTDASWATLAADGVHPSPEGYRLIAEFVAARIARPGATAAVQAPNRGARLRDVEDAKPRASKRAPAPEPDPFVRKAPAGADAR